VQGAWERERVAISNSGYTFPTKKVIVNLARLDMPFSLLCDGVNSRFSWCHGVRIGVRLPRISSPFR
jgi:hypothetical protein